MHNSPTTPTGANSPSSSTTYNCVFAIGRPIGTPPASPFSSLSSSSSFTSYTQHPTTVSVGPYSFTNRVPFASSRHHLTSSHFSASPPITSTPALPLPPPYPANSSATNPRCAGVSFTTLYPLPSPSTFPNPPLPRSSSPPPLTSTTFPPLTSGPYKLVTARSNPNELCTGAPIPISTPSSS